MGEEPDAHLVFVYGTLRRSGSNGFRLAGSMFLGEGGVRGRLYRISWYPGLILDDQADLVRGEVWRVSSETLAQLDEFEGLPGNSLVGEEYRRRQVPLGIRGEGERVWIWEWLGNPSPEDLIIGGDWLGE